MDIEQAQKIAFIVENIDRLEREIGCIDHVHGGNVSDMSITVDIKSNIRGSRSLKSSGAISFECFKILKRHKEKALQKSKKELEKIK